MDSFKEITQLLAIGLLSTGGGMAYQTHLNSLEQNQPIVQITNSKKQKLTLTNLVDSPKSTEKSAVHKTEPVIYQVKKEVISQVMEKPKEQLVAQKNKPLEEVIKTTQPVQKNYTTNQRKNQIIMANAYRSLNRTKKLLSESKKLLNDPFWKTKKGKAATKIINKVLEKEIKNKYSSQTNNPNYINTPSKKNKYTINNLKFKQPMPKQYSTKRIIKYHKKN